MKKIDTKVVLYELIFSEFRLVKASFLIFSSLDEESSIALTMPAFLESLMHIWEFTHK